MQGHIPLELVGATSVAVILIERAVARAKFRIVVTEQTKAITDQASGLPREVRTDTEATDVTSSGHAPSGRELPKRSQAHDWFDPILVAAQVGPAADVEIDVQIGIADAGIGR